MTRRRVVLFTLACLLSLEGCGDGLAEKKATYIVAILGDTTRIDLLTNIATAHKGTVKTSGPRKVTEVHQPAALFRFESSAEDNVATQATIAWEADLILLAVDATEGPLPIHREHILVTRQKAVPTVVIAFTKGRAMDDPELLELEELEVRELLNKYDLPGDRVPCVFDDQATKTTAGSKASKGPTQIVELLGTIAKKRIKDRENKQFKASIYSLLPQEAFTRDVATGVKSGSATVVVGNESIEVEVTAPREITPGENAEIQILFAKPMRVGEGQHFLLLNKQHIAATGFFIAEGADSR